MSVTLIRPGTMTLAGWKAIYQGGECSLDPAAWPLVARAAEAVAAIVARGEPVYGINTGFGKLAGSESSRATSRGSSGTSCCRTRPGLVKRCRCRSLVS